MSARIRAAIKNNLRPEMVNRLSSIVHFHPLAPVHIREIVGKCLAALNTRLVARQVTVTLSSEVVELIVQEGFNESFGARELERTMERLISKRPAHRARSRPGPACRSNGSLGGWIGEC